jgi:hypothetical protein
MAGSLKDTAETALLQLIFNNDDWAGIGDAGGLQNSAAAGSLYIALFTSAPTDSAQGTECNYTGYARKAVARSAAGFTVSGSNASNTAAITFDPCTEGSGTAIAFAICNAGTAGVDDAIIWGDISSPAGGLAISAGITPNFAIGVLDVNLD